MVHDLDDRIVFWNHGAERIYGWSAQEAIGRNASEFLFGAQAPGLAEAIQAVQAKGEWFEELRQVTRQGKEIVVVSRWTLLRDGQGKPKSKLVINTDVTEKKQMEVRYLRAQRLESIGLLAGGIAHDLNNILSPLLMGVGLLKTTCTGEMSQALLATMQTSVERGAELVQQILAFGRGTEGSRQPLLLGPLIRGLVKLLAQSFPKSITLRTAISEDLWLVFGDSTQVHQVLTNLCLNARDAMPQGGSLSISARNQVLEADGPTNFEFRPGPHVVVEVEDTGTGIAPEVLDKVFDPFFTTKEVGKGTGLGLTIAQSILQSHGGSMRIHSEVGKGTRFTLALPALGAPAAEEAEVSPRELPVGKGELLLVVDDEAALQQLAQATLTTAGYRVLLARNGAEALALYAEKAQEIQVVLTDMMMPVMDGPATIKALRQINPNVKIIAFSGLVTGKEVVAPSAGEVRAFIAKPYTVEALLTTLRSVVEAP
jgi:two-component system, cell cycle sensor histidine kinase and response regulator CckA